MAPNLLLSGSRFSLNNAMTKPISSLTLLRLRLTEIVDRGTNLEMDSFVPYALKGRAREKKKY